MFNVQIASETDLLRRVVVHTPGHEMALVSPENRETLLFEDILWVEHARREHELMCAVFQKVVGGPDGVIQISSLLEEAFAEEEARVAFVRLLCEVAPERNLQVFEPELVALDAQELLAFALTGVSDLPINADPLPNLMFTRDVAAAFGKHLILSHPATAARARESIIMNVVMRHHPAFADDRDQVIRLPRGVTFEGGDLLVVDADTVLIGESQRTSFGGVLSIAKALFERDAAKRVIMVNLPKKRSCMHLDTVFTFTSPTECVAYPPLIELNHLSNVVELQPGSGSDRLDMTIHDDLHSALQAATGRDFTFIPCGGGDPLSQRREQWTDGANFFALAPGVVIGYERNARTFELMSQHGYRVVSAEGFLSYHEESSFDPGEKLAIKLDGHELSRGRGGPRCMTMPLTRSATA